MVHLQDYLLKRQHIDTLLILGSGPRSSVASSEAVEFATQYRYLVNPHLLMAAIDLSSASARVDNTDVATKGGASDANRSNVFISGYSDQLLRFIADRGDGEQLIYIEKIDEAKNLQARPLRDAPKKTKRLAMREHVRDLKHPEVTVKPMAALPAPPVTSSWRTARIFISSTFSDMQSERDALVKYVFPALRERCRQHKIHLYEVDLRWGITAKEAEASKSLQLCLDEIDRCRPFFIGMLGGRYGYVPPTYDVEDVPHLDWLKYMPAGRSVTELEFEYGALRTFDGRSTPARSLFCLRDMSFVANMPEELHDTFVSKAHADRITDLRRRIEAAEGPASVVRTRPSWGGMLNGKPVLGGLEDFQARVLEELWHRTQLICMCEFSDTLCCSYSRRVW